MNSAQTLSFMLQIPLWTIHLSAFIIGALAVGRVTRVIYYDDFPPSIWFRTWWDSKTEESSWNLLFHCPWCLSHWVAAAALGIYVLGLFVGWVGWVWWIGAIWFALGYVAAMIIARDEPEE